MKFKPIPLVILPAEEDVDCYGFISAYRLSKVAKLVMVVNLKPDQLALEITETTTEYLGWLPGNLNSDKWALVEVLRPSSETKAEPMKTKRKIKLDDVLLPDNS